MKAVIFDLDGVIVSTDEFHYQAWWAIAHREGIYFDRAINERLRGVGRMESLDIMLEKSEKRYSDDEKLKLSIAKNAIYKDLLKQLNENDILPGVSAILSDLQHRGFKIGIGSSSRNTPFILKQIGLENTFDAVADGNDIKNSKPDPEVFLVAAKKLKTAPRDCVVVEDAYAGVEAAKNAGMKVVGVGAAANHTLADIREKDLTGNIVEKLMRL